MTDEQLVAIAAVYQVGDQIATRVVMIGADVPATSRSTATARSSILPPCPTPLM